MKRHKERLPKEPCERCGRKRVLRFWWGEELCEDCVLEDVENNTVELDDIED